MLAHVSRKGSREFFEGDPVLALRCEFKQRFAQSEFIGGDVLAERAPDRLGGR